MGQLILIAMCVWLGYEVAMWLIFLGRYLASKYRARKALDALMTLQRALDRKDRRKGARSVYRAGLRP